MSEGWESTRLSHYKRQKYSESTGIIPNIELAMIEIIHKKTLPENKYLKKNEKVNEINNKLKPIDTRPEFGENLKSLKVGNDLLMDEIVRHVHTNDGLIQDGI